MGKRLVRFRKSGEARWGLVRGTLVHELTIRPRGLGELLRNLDAAVGARASEGIPVADLELLSPVTAPSALKQRVARALFSERKLFEIFVRQQAKNPSTSRTAT